MAIWPVQAYTGDNFVLTSAKDGQDPNRIFGIHRFCQLEIAFFLGYGDHGISPNDKALGELKKNLERFAASEVLGILPRIFFGKSVFIHAGRDNFKLFQHRPEEFSTAR